jgi:hypothetical protein
LDTRREIVSKWRKRFFYERVAGLEEKPRTGRQPVFPPEVVVAVKAIACELPATLGMPLSHLHVLDVRAEVIRQGLVAEINGATIWRWLSEDAIRPWTHRSWIFPRDPDFAAKAARVLDLYHRIWNRRPLGPDEYVLSADEKTSIQARIRLHPTTPPQPAGPPEWNTDTREEERWPIWPPGTFTRPESSAAANQPPASHPSGVSSKM